MWLCRSRVLHTPHRGWLRLHRGEGGGRAAKAAGSLRVPGTKACPCWCPLRGCVVVASGVIVASTSSHARMVSFPECITCLFSVSRSCIAKVLEAVLSVRTGIPQHVHSVRRASLCTACNSTGTNGLATGGVFASPIRRTYFPLVASAACRESGALRPVLDPPVRVAQATAASVSRRKRRPVGRTWMGSVLSLVAAVAAASAVTRFWHSVSRHTVDPIWILNCALVHL